MLVVLISDIRIVRTMKGLRCSSLRMRMAKCIVVVVYSHSKSNNRDCLVGVGGSFR